MSKNIRGTKVIENSEVTMANISSLISNLLDSKFVAIDKRFESIDKKLSTIDTKFGEVDGRLGRLEYKVSGLSGHVMKLDNDIKDLRDDVGAGFAELGNYIDGEVSSLAGMVQRGFQEQAKMFAMRSM
ncbi:MAG: hypothetical protein WCP09_04075 [Candidatus Taylorbacteria bacterium]